jgi:uncharacterized OB-fold protein
VTDGVLDETWDAGIVVTQVNPTTTVQPTTTLAQTTTTLAQTTTTTVPPVTASTLPFTGFELQATFVLGLIALAGGVLILIGSGRRGQDGGDEVLGGW